MLITIRFDDGESIGFDIQEQDVRLSSGEEPSRGVKFFNVSALFFKHLLAEQIAIRGEDQSAMRKLGMADARMEEALFWAINAVLTNTAQKDL